MMKYLMVIGSLFHGTVFVQISHSISRMCLLRAGTLIEIRTAFDSVFNDWIVSMVHVRNMNHLIYFSIWGKIVMATRRA